MTSAFGIEHGDIEKSMADDAYKAVMNRPGRLKRLRASADKPYQAYGTTRADRIGAPITEALSAVANPKRYVNEIKLARKAR